MRGVGHSRARMALAVWQIPLHSALTRGRDPSSTRPLVGSQLTHRPDGRSVF